MPEQRGAFIVFEGVDGSGKSTQAFLLAKYLGEEQVKAVATREPGGTETGERIREILLDPHGEGITAVTELLLYMASRAQHVENLIKPALARGEVVVCERFLWSSIAYQGYGLAVPVETIEEIGALAVGDVVPDLTIVLDMDPAAALERERGPGSAPFGRDRIERRGVEFEKKVRAGFLELAERFAGRTAVVDAARPPKEVHEDVKALVEDVLRAD